MVLLKGGGKGTGPGIRRRDERPCSRCSGRNSDLADEVDRRGEGLIAFFPLGGAHLAWVGVDVLGGLNLAD